MISFMADLAVYYVLLVYFGHVSGLKEFYLSKIDDNVAEGRYIYSSKAGIFFKSTNVSLSILDLIGNDVLLIEKTQNYKQVIKIMDDIFIQEYYGKEYRDFYVPSFMLTSALDDTIIKTLDALPLDYHQSHLQRSITTLIKSPYYNLIKRTVNTLAIDLQLYGNLYPSILPLYFVSNMLEKLETARLNTCPVLNKNEDCFKQCPPCPDEECLSLCGYGCHCWKWVCGDCCYHLGCHGHDVCCRKNFIQTKCLFPISFKCDSEYIC